MKKNHMLKNCLWVCFTLGSALYGQCPKTIPAMQECSAENGTYTFSSNSRIVLDSIHARHMVQTATVLAEDLFYLTREKGAAWLIPVVISPTASEGDIFLTLNTDQSLRGPEGYSLNIGENLIISGRSDTGAFNGTRSILQLLKQDYTIQGLRAKDWPNYPERALNLDNGRKYFTMPWIRKHIRELGYLKYNTFQWHFSDGLGFRIESERYPEIVSTDHLTKEEVRELIALGNKYKITIIPELDMPGHMGNILRARGELRLPGEGPGSQFIDIGNDSAYRFMESLIEEYAELFTGPYYHIGADEYWIDYNQFPHLLTYARQNYGNNANPKDSYLGFINWAVNVVKSNGKITRVWNDGLHGGNAVTLTKDFIVDHWRHGLSPQEFVNKGQKVINSNGDDLYYVPGKVPVWKPDPAYIYNTLEPHMFAEDKTVAPNEPLLLGAKLHIWTDIPSAENEEQIAAGMRESFRSLTQKTWGSPKIASNYSGFSDIIDDVGSAPGFTNESYPYGCTNPKAANYDADAPADNGVCLIVGCMDPSFAEFDAEANVSDPEACQVTTNITTKNWPNGHLPLKLRGKKLSVFAKSELSIRDYLGKEALRLKCSGRCEFDLSNEPQLTPGLYFITMQGTSLVKQSWVNF